MFTLVLWISAFVTLAAYWTVAEWAISTKTFQNITEASSHNLFEYFPSSLLFFSPFTGFTSYWCFNGTWYCYKFLYFYISIFFDCLWMKVTSSILCPATSSTLLNSNLNSYFGWCFNSEIFPWVLFANFHITFYWYILLNAIKFEILGLER